ncbi:MAG TPA: Fe(2+) transporter permease subunit FeoB, partial [Desulfobacteraceae bacterium]|nr:Fe(2+) transporter permease subunit FeoB [Desulfobacteraceae bacterium]
DEEVARNYILSGETDLIVNILDASNLQRNLYLTVQLLEMKIPLVVVLNMMDMAESRDIRIDVPALSKNLGCQVVPVVASRNRGIDSLKSVINEAAGNKAISETEVAYPVEIQEAVDELAAVIQSINFKKKIDPHWAAVKLLEGDRLISGFVGDAADEIINRRKKEIDEKSGDEADILVAGSRYRLINDLTKETVNKTPHAGRTLSDMIDRIMLNRALGIPVFLAAMYLMFMITINLGGAFIDFFDIFAGTLFVDGLGELLSAVGASDWLKAVFAGGLGGGIQTVATFIPPIGFMFLCLSFLEDSGYMARAAFVMDRFMRLIGLPGKSFVPMLVGFGCNVPAIMATRTLENQRDRTLTIMMNPFMSCGARLPVYALFAAAFFPTGGQNLVFVIYLIGIGFAVLTGFFLKNSLLQGEITPFVMELPPYHMPTVKGVLLRAWDRLKSFMFRAGKVIIPVVVILSFLNSMGTDGSFGNEDTDRSALSSIGKSITPVFAPMGITAENWPATVGIFTGIFAKEAVVGTLNAMYAHLDDAAGKEGEEEGSFDFWNGIKEAFVSIPENLAGIAGSFLDPLGISIGNVSSIEAAAEEQGVSTSVFGSMTRLFDGKIGAFAYLLFILLYFPCVAAIAAVYRETNLNWTLFAGLWTTGLAYTAATIFYQIATIGSHPAASIAWIAILTAILTAVFFFMKNIGRKAAGIEPTLTAPAGA